ncbi:PREDICTED: SAGA-associated factor 29 isoform X2 [Nicrophorus vespilloides]|uniref:SAGA-associated factor 29 isoform X2 n=1 Tax=Nicrophorus vespilloides TaxID=110193 RepID=A0ABM1M947_NICVS|nr:PREDICTED: SAGA-associated factor 29 isoform X2 [Nicrophorus vespilloides]XP_017771099.1 PREDICTED: SAGA-associated factor 29 isoform X2 [Nicrophorus vespilloides]
MPFTPDTIAAEQVQERLKSLFDLVQEIQKRRTQCETGINSIYKHQTSPDEEKSSQYQTKLKTLYKTAVNHAEQEEEMLREALNKITEIRNIKNERRIQARQAGNKESIRPGICMKMLKNNAQTMPLFVGKIGEKPPPLCGAIAADPAYHAKVGDMVVSWVEVADDGVNWILSEVVSFNASTTKYEVDDIIEERNQIKRHVVAKKFVVPLPLMRANPETDPEALFPQGTLVMALYPQTTCFYKAIINKCPATHVDEYEVLFEDTKYEEGYSPPYLVAQRYVISGQVKQQQAGISETHRNRKTISTIPHN